MEIGGGKVMAFNATFNNIGNNGTFFTVILISAFSYENL
jgi:hypothetical protein